MSPFDFKQFRKRNLGQEKGVGWHKNVPELAAQYFFCSILLSSLFFPRKKIRDELTQVTSKGAKMSPF